ncbi:MAG: hypothetical protein ABUU24_04370, partial [Variovorax sp.]
MTSSTWSRIPAVATAGVRFCATALFGLGLIASSASAQTALADGPLFSSNNVPGNLGLLLSVEYPTAISVAHT